MLGRPNRIRGAPSGPDGSQSPSMAATFMGWCSSVFSPCRSPMPICSGATIAAIHIAIENIVRTAGVARPRSRCQAATPLTMKATTR